MKTNNLSLDPEKISKILNVSWKHYELPVELRSVDGDFKDRDSYIFEINSKHGLLKLSFHKRIPNQVTIQFVGFGFTFTFGDITRIENIEYNHSVIFEQKSDRQFSQVYITRDGYVNLHIGRPISEYKKGSFCETFSNEQHEVDNNQGKTYFQRYLEKTNSSK